MWEVIVPDYNRPDEWHQVETFNTKREALDFAKQNFGADSKGRVQIVSELPIEDDLE